MNKSNETGPDLRKGAGGRLFWVSRRGALITLILIHLAALVAVLIEYLHPLVGVGHGVERVDGLEFLASYAVYGFVACVALVLLGRVLRRLVMRDEVYYGDDG